MSRAALVSHVELCSSSRILFRSFPGIFDTDHGGLVEINESNDQAANAASQEVEHDRSQPNTPQTQTPPSSQAPDLRKFSFSVRVASLIICLSQRIIAL
jgi:hypothetical protein